MARQGKTEKLRKKEIMEKRKKEKKKKVVKRREKTWQKQGHALIDYLFPPSSANPLFGIPKVVISSHLGPFLKMHNFNGKSL